MTSAPAWRQHGRKKFRLQRPHTQLVYRTQVHREDALGREDPTVDSTSTDLGTPSGSPSPRDPGTESILTLATGVLAGVGSVFVGTHSVLITLIAAVTAITLTIIVIASRR